MLAFAAPALAADLELVNAPLTGGPGKFAVEEITFEHQAALRHLGDALDHWKRYAAIRDAQYVPALYNRVGFVDVTALTEKVAADIEIARNWKPGSLKDDGRRSGSERGFRK